MRCRPSWLIRQGSEVSGEFAHCVCPLQETAHSIFFFKEVDTLGTPDNYLWVQHKYAVVLLASSLHSK